MLVQHQLIGLSVCQSGRFFLSSLQPIYPVSSQVSINLQRFIFISDLLSFSLIAWLSFLIQCSIFLISSFFLLAVCPTLIIQPPLVSVPSCGKKISQSSVHEFLMQSWFWFVQNCRLWFVMPSKLDLLKAGGRDLWCEASLNGIQIFIRRCKANLTGSPNWGGGSKQGGAHRHHCWLHHRFS